jgi:hypothetical protein
LTLRFADLSGCAARNGPCAMAEHASDFKDGVSFSGCRKKYDERLSDFIPKQSMPRH